MALPSLSNSPTKEKIIELLSNRWPLTAKKIYRSLLKEYNLSITYQAIHKSLQELIQNSILEKTKEGYQISKEWIKNLGNFSKKIEEELSSEKQKKEIKTMQKFIFENHSEFVKFTIDFMEETIKKEKKLKITFLYRHVPYPNVISREDIQRLKSIMPKTKWTILSRYSTPLDLWHAKLWKNFGVFAKTGADISEDRVIIINNHIIHAYVPNKSIKKWDDSYAINKASEFDITETMEAISNSKFKTIATLFEDKELARFLHG